MLHIVNHGRVATKEIEYEAIESSSTHRNGRRSRDCGDRVRRSTPHGSHKIQEDVFEDVQIIRKRCLLFLKYDFEDARNSKGCSKCFLDCFGRRFGSVITSSGHPWVHEAMNDRVREIIE